MASLYFLISLLLHPVFVTSVLAILYLTINPNGSPIPDREVYPIIIVNTLLFPIVTVLLLKALGFIKSIKLENQRERIIPIIASMTFYFWGYLVARNLSIDSYLQMLLLAGFINLSGLLFLGMYMKPSLHTSTWTVAALWLMICALYTNPSFYLLSAIAFVLLALLYYARFQLKAHTKKELIVGSVLGIASMAIAYAVI